MAPGDRGWSLCSSDTKAFFGCADIDKGANPPPDLGRGRHQRLGAGDLRHRRAGDQRLREDPRRARPRHRSWSSRSSSAPPRTWARRPTGRAPAWSTRSRRCSWPQSINGGSAAGQLAVRAPVVAERHGQRRASRRSSTSTSPTRATSPQTVTPSVIGAPQPLSNDTGIVDAQRGIADVHRRRGQHRLLRRSTRSRCRPGRITSTATSHGTRWPAGGSGRTRRCSTRRARWRPTRCSGANESGFGHVEVRQPAAGTWTAVIFTVHNAARVRRRRSSSATRPSSSTTPGAVFPSSRTLRPGQSANFRVQVPGRAGRRPGVPPAPRHGLQHGREHPDHRPLAGAALPPGRSVRRAT